MKANIFSLDGALLSGGILAASGANDCTWNVSAGINWSNGRAFPAVLPAARIVVEVKLIQSIGLGA